MLGTIIQAELEEMIRDKNWTELRKGLADLHPSDIAEIIIDLPPDEEGVVFRVLPRDQAAAVFTYLPRAQQTSLIQSLSTELTGGIISQMAPDDRTRLLEEMPAEVTRKLLEKLSPEQLKAARELLGYPADSAGRFMTPQYAALRPNMTAREALNYLRNIGRAETLAVLYVVDKDGKLLGDVRLSSLVLADPQQKVVDLREPQLLSIPATATKDEVVDAFKKYDRVALPVVDSGGRMLGMITVDDILDVAEAEATEEMQKMGGTQALDAPYLETGLLTMIKKRGGWLSILFLGEMLTASAMGFFAHEIEKAVVLALFVPLIISTGGNSGSQATSLIIRAMALRELGLRDWLRVLRRELASGLILGMFVGMVGFLLIVLGQSTGLTDFTNHYVLVGITIWISLIGIVMLGTLAGSMLPFLLRRLSFDPATSSAPFVATIVDVTGVCIYFGVAWMILRHTLLAG